MKNIALIILFKTKMKFYFILSSGYISTSHFDTYFKDYAGFKFCIAGPTLAEAEEHLMGKD